MNNQLRNGFVMPLVLAIIAVLIIGGGAYIMLRNKQVPKEEVKTEPQNTASTTLDTAAWKTYRNEKYGYTISYPADYHFEEDGTVEFPHFSLTVRNSGPRAPIIIGYSGKYAATYNGSIMDFARTYEGRAEKIKVGSIDGAKVFSTQEDDQGLQSKVIEIIAIKNSQPNLLFGVKFWQYDASVEQQVIFNNILSTLKFTEQVQAHSSSTSLVIHWDASKAQGSVVVNVYPYPVGKQVFQETVPNTGNYTLNPKKFWGQEVSPGQYDISVVDKIGGQILYDSVVYITY